MQRIKNENSGVTLMALVITIITFLIIMSITITYGISTLHEVTNNKMETELAIVQEAIIQQYALVKSKKEDGKIASQISADIKLESDTQRPVNLIGTRIASISTLTSNDFIDYIIDYTNTENMSYEEYYYLLDEADLKTIGIEKSNTQPTENEKNKNRSYIVNYVTGEVFDIANKKYYKTDYNMLEDPIFIKGSDSKIESETYDFTDE